MKSIKSIMAAGLLCLFGAEGAAAADYALQGYVRYNTAEKMGWYLVKPDGATEFAWADLYTTSLNSPLVFGWMRNGRICGISSRLEEGRLYSYQYLEINPANGEYVVSKAVSMSNDDSTINYLNYYTTAAYDPVTDRVYGYGYNATGKAWVFKSSTYDFSETTVIREIEDDELCSSMTFNESENRLVGFNRQYFVYIDTKTGQQTRAWYPAVSDYQFSYTGLTYDMTQRAYYWNYFTKDNRSHLALVDITGKKMTTVRDYDDMTNFSCLMPMERKADPEAPAKAEFSEISFPNGALSGNVSFTLPEKTNAGEAIKGEIDWTLSIDGNEVKSGKGTAGAAETVEVKDLTTGEHVFMLTVKIGDIVAIPTSEVRYIGVDTPAAPSSVTLGATEATWEAVTTGAHGGYIDAAAVKYNVKLNGKDAGTTAETKLAVPYPDADYAAYTVTVSATAGTLTSTETESNVFRTGKALALPQTFVPDNIQAPLFSTEDADGNGNCWTFNNGSRGSELFISGQSTDTAADEWLFLPPVACSQADGVYSFSVNAALNSATDDKAMIEVRAGRSADSKAMTTTIVPLTEVKSTSLKEFSGLFTLSGELAGATDVVIGVRAYAPDGGARIKARRFRAELTKLSGEAPAEISDVNIEPGEKGALNATVSFTMPARLLNGKVIPADTDVTVTVLNDSKVTLTGKPGSKQEKNIEAYRGINEIEITPAIGNVKGQARKYEVYCGPDIPGRVRDIKAEVMEDNLEAYVTWKAPDTGMNGGYVDPEDITYWLCTYDKASETYKQYAELGKTTEYAMQLREGARLATYDVIIQAVSGAGASSEYASVRVQLGAPYNLDMNETFVGADNKPQIHYSLSPLTTGEYDNTEWNVGDPSNNNPEWASPSGIALIGTTSAAGSTGYMLFPKFSTKGKNDVQLSFTVCQTNATPKVKVYASTVGMTDYELIGDLPAEGAGYTPQIVELPEKYDNQGWVSVYITVSYETSYQTLIIQGYDFTAETTGIEDTIAEGGISLRRIFATEGGVRVLGAAGETVEVFAADGRKAASRHAISDAETISLAPGLYIVKAGDASEKVLVK